MTNFYTRPTTHNLNQFKNIAAAYAAAGLTAPTYVEDLKAHINTAPSVEQVAASIAAESLDATDAAEFYADALARIQQAQAAEALKVAFNRHIQTALDAKAGSYRRTAAEDLAPSFNKIAKAFTAAAAKLPAHAPLNTEANIEAGTGTEYKTARDTLAQLGTYAAIHPQGTPSDGVPVSIMAVLPLLSLPTATVERIKPNIGIETVVINKSQLTETYTIRKLAEDLTRDTDQTLTHVAAGKYAGVSLALATPAELAQRRANASRAFTRTTDNTVSANAMVAL